MINLSNKQLRVVRDQIISRYGFQWTRVNRACSQRLQWFARHSIAPYYALFTFDLRPIARIWSYLHMLSELLSLIYINNIYISQSHATFIAASRCFYAWGDSLGAILAYEFARLWHQDPSTNLLGLFASGHLSYTWWNKGTNQERNQTSLVTSCDILWPWMIFGYWCCWRQDKMEASSFMQFQNVSFFFKHAGKALEDFVPSHLTSLDICWGNAGPPEASKERGMGEAVMETWRSIAHQDALSMH